MKELTLYLYYSVIAYYIQPKFIPLENLSLIHRLLEHTLNYFVFSYVFLAYMFMASTLVFHQKGGTLKEILRPLKILIGYYLFRQLYLIIYSP